MKIRPVYFNAAAFLVCAETSIEAYVALVIKHFGGGVAAHFRHFSLLTQVNCIMLACYYAVALLKLRKRGIQAGLLLKRFFTVVMVTATLVAITYWALYAIHPPLIHPKGTELFYPWHLNYRQHILVCAIPWIDVILIQPEPYFGQQIGGDLKALGGFAATMLGAFFLYSRARGKWPYPFQNHMGFVGHLAFDVSVTILMLVIFFGVRALQRWLVNWRRPVRTIDTRPGMRVTRSRIRSKKQKQ